MASLPVDLVNDVIRPSFRFGLWLSDDSFGLADLILALDMGLCRCALAKFLSASLSILNTVWGSS